MNMHKNTRLTPHHRQAIWPAYTQGKESVTSLARRYQCGYCYCLRHGHPSR